MVFSMVPGRITVSAVTNENADAVADTSTMDTWQNFFPTGSNLTTQNAGMVWTDKSVFTDVPAGLPSDVTMTANQDDNFLVALSVMASNKTIKGYSTIPTDTIFVLDLSSSMTRNGDMVNGRETSAIDDLVVATNAAITKLLALNEHNRVGVVLFAGNTNGDWQNRVSGTVTILPLARYTAGDDGKFLIATDGDNTVEVAANVKDTKGNVSGKKASTSGTFTQDGLFEAMVEFLEADTVIEDGKIQAGTSRKPILVLMSDGEPTMANPDFDGNFNSDTMTATDLGQTTMSAFNRGGYDEQKAREEIAFMTQLTAMLVNSVVEDHYEQDMLFYTLAYGEEAVERAEAMSVLNPAQECTALNALWNKLQRDKRVSVFQNLNNSWNNYTTATVQPNDYVTPGNEKFEGRVYVDKFYPANTDANFATAFADITNEIVLQSQYVPTLVDSGNHDLDGYVSFVDHIGHHMEVTDIKGMTIGDTLFSGATFSEYIVTGKGGSIAEPTPLGDEFIRSVKARLGITDTAAAQQLIQQAYNAGQIHWNSDTDYGNHVGWYSDANGNYLGFWNEDPNAQAPAGATHTNKSYGFLGKTDATHGVKDSDMMYTTVRIRTEIATGDVTLAWAIPAALIPTISYEVELDGDTYDSDMKNIRLAEGSATAPIRLLFEVALDERITEYNVAQLASDAYDAASGKYVFYTNDWVAERANSVNTYAYFEASKQNERYYYTEDTIIYRKVNDTYVPYTDNTKLADDTFYRTYYVYESGKTNADVQYVAISNDALVDAEKSDNNWVIPKGTYYQMLSSPTEPKPSTPPTGDESNIAMWGLTMAVSLAALVVLLMAKRPKGKYERT